MIKALEDEKVRKFPVRAETRGRQKVSVRIDNSRHKLKLSNLF